MGRRGPKPGGLEMTVIKLPGGVRTALMAAATKGDRNLSEEIRRRLQNSLYDLADERTRGLMLLLQSTLRSAMGARKMSSWLDDPYAFDQAVTAITTVLEAIRPAGSIAGAGLHGAFAARGTLADVQMAPMTAPADASAHRREMVMIRQMIGDVVADRALVYGKTARQARADEPARLELVALRKKEAHSVRGEAPALTCAEERRMKALIARLLTLAH